MCMHTVTNAKIHGLYVYMHIEKILKKTKLDVRLNVFKSTLEFLLKHVHTCSGIHLRLILEVHSRCPNPE